MPLLEPVVGQGYHVGRRHAAGAGRDRAGRAGCGALEGQQVEGLARVPCVLGDERGQRAGPPAGRRPHLRPGEQTTFPVVDAAGALLGVVTMADLARLKEEATSAEDGRVAADVAGPIEAVTLSDTLLEANRRMGVRGTPVLPVLAVDSHRLIGIVSRSHILAAYERALTEGRIGDH